MSDVKLKHIYVNERIGYMKRQHIILVTMLICFFCCGCSKYDDAPEKENEAETKTYVMPIELYTFTDTDELDDSDKLFFNQQILQNIRASQDDESLKNGQYDEETGLISLSFDASQKDSYISSLKYYLQSDSATLFSDGEYKLLQYSEDTKIIKIKTTDNETFEKYWDSFEMSVDIMLQLQILDGVSYEDAVVTAEITYDNGTYIEQTLTWKDIY